MPVGLKESWRLGPFYSETMGNLFRHPMATITKPAVTGMKKKRRKRGKPITAPAEIYNESDDIPSVPPMSERRGEWGSPEEMGGGSKRLPSWKRAPAGLKRKKQKTSDRPFGEPKIFRSPEPGTFMSPAWRPPKPLLVVKQRPPPAPKPGVYIPAYRSDIFYGPGTKMKGKLPPVGGKTKLAERLRDEIDFRRRAGARMYENRRLPSPQRREMLSEFRKLRRAGSIEDFL
jgi:hypothetical protein